MARIGNILDPIHEELDPTVFDNPERPEPRLKLKHRNWIKDSVYRTLDGAGYDGMDEWLQMIFTGSLTTYQYSPDSDVDISLFVNADKFPEWSRAEMIGIMVEHMDGTTLPGTTHVMQCFVIPNDVDVTDLYKPGLRSGYDMDNQTWIVAPEKGRVHNVEQEMNAAYVHALEQADKMDRLLKYEPDKAVTFWHQIHKRRRRDHQAGKGDYSDSNITYKMLANRNLFPAISEVSGEYIAHVPPRDNSGTVDHTSRLQPVMPSDRETRTRPQIPSQQGYGDGRLAPTQSDHSHNVRTVPRALFSVEQYEHVFVQPEPASSFGGYERSIRGRTSPPSTDDSRAGNPYTATDDRQQTWTFDESDQEEVHADKDPSKSSYELDARIESVPSISDVSGEYIAKTAKRPAFSGILPTSEQIEEARRQLGLKTPVRVLPTYSGRGGYAGISRDPITGQQSHLVYVNPEKAHGPRNWALWHELGHAQRVEQGGEFTPNNELSDEEYWQSPNEQHAEGVADQYADHDLWLNS